MPDLPSYSELFLDLPLYSKIRFDREADDTDYVYDLKRERHQFDAHCVGCEKESTFRRVMLETGSPPGPGIFGRANQEFFAVEFRCTRVGHRMVFFFHVLENVLVKMGQSPSMESIAGADIEKYRKVLGDNYFSELHRATGLASHGVGIGAFVYLRRIFERLIQDHYAEHVDKHSELEGFQTLRMDEKIAVLKNSLPPLLVETKATYGILSNGVHLLDEATCLKHFPVVRAAIILILEQDLKARAAKDAEENLKQKIADLSGNLKNKSKAEKNGR